MTDEKRNHQRIWDTALLYVPVELAPLPPVIKKAINGNMINLSKGGMAILLGQQIPVGNHYHLRITLPDRSKMETPTAITRVTPKENRFLIGLQFSGLPDYMGKKIDKMASDYNACEVRIENQEENICRLDCGFYVMCQKRQKADSDRILNEKLMLELEAQRDPGSNPNAS